jgi:DNA-binding MarR family transcriptional regulator
VTHHDQYTSEILTEIDTGRPVTQRELSQKLGIALGLTNLLVRRIVQKGWVKMTHLKANRVAYFITPAGLVEKGRLTQAYFDNTIRLYTETRSRITRRFEELSAGWSHDGGQVAEKRIVFYGAGEVAEIGYVGLRETDLHLIGVVDDQRTGSFFEFPIDPPEQLKKDNLNGKPFDFLVVMTFRKAPKVIDRLGVLEFPLDRVLWLDGGQSSLMIAQRAGLPASEPRDGDADPPEDRSYSGNRR